MNPNVVYVKGDIEFSSARYTIASRAKYPMLQPRVSAVILAAIVLSACNRTAKESPPPDADAANAAVVAWREKHETDYRRDFVSIAGLHILKPGTNTAGSDKTNDIVLSATPPSLGKFVLEGQNVRFEPATGVKVLLKNQPVTTPIDLKADVTHDSDELVIGDVRLAAHVSGDSRSIRVRDPNGPLAKGFLGFTWFPVDAQYRVVGRLIKDAEPRKLKVLNTYNDVDEYSTEGVVEFNLLGQTLRLRPFTTRPKRFYIVFRDASSGHETYETARLLYSDLRDDGTTVLDFNAAYNPPCAFNQFTTCPIPLKENRLPVKILAGERAYVAKTQTGGS